MWVNPPPTQHWVASIVEKRVSDPWQLPASFAALPADQDAWASWLTEGASLLAAAWADADADAPMWNPAGEAMRSDPRAVPHVKRAAELAQFDPIVCKVVHVRHS
jgi:hypothetical protein